MNSAALLGVSLYGIAVVLSRFRRGHYYFLSGDINFNMPVIRNGITVRADFFRFLLRAFPS